MDTQKIKAFTLVELIVTILILTILGAIAFISLQGYSKDARNSARVSDINNIELALELFILKAGKYPEPGEFTNIIGTGGIVLWKKGIVNNEIIQKLSRVSQTPTDPKTGIYMEYATTLNRKEYELKYEFEDTVDNEVVSPTYAETLIPYVQGTYNGVYLMGEDNYYYAVPSLHTSSGTEVSTPSDFDLNGQTIKDFQVTQLVYSGVTLNANNIRENYGNFALALKNIYGINSELNYGLYAVLSGIDNSNAEEFGEQIISGTYKDPDTILGDSCLANASYSIGSLEGTYNIPQVIDTFSWNGTSDVNENNGIFQYTLSLDCDNGDYINLVETGPVRQSCDSGYDPIGNECVISYTFSSHTFTPCGQSGSYGPSLGQCTTVYTTTWDENPEIFTVDNGIQIWTVPATGTYNIEVYGARGGSGSCPAGYGAKMSGDFNLTQGEKIKILVGQMGGATNGGGGGGGTFVAQLDNTPLIIAGGGGGGTYYSCGGNGDASITTSGRNCSGCSNASCNPPGIGGVDGNGGSSGGGLQYAASCGGGGFYTDGYLYDTSTVNTNCEYNGSTSGVAFINGGNGGLYGGTPNTHAYGGFGGGGGGTYWEGVGGGGGYSGGGACSHVGRNKAGGGGSYNIGVNQVNSEGANYGDGYVIIQKL